MKKMKKIALILVGSALLFSCGTATTKETPAQDSTAVSVVVDTLKPAVVETSSVVVVDSTKKVK